MRFATDTVVFKSADPWYTREASGAKPNTLRILTPQEFLTIAEFDPHFIRIQSGEEVGVSFTRKLLSFYELGMMAGHMLVIFSWEV